MIEKISGATRGELESAEDYWRAFSDVREPLYERVLRATGEEHLDVKAESSFGNLNWREWLLFMRIHDLDHARQLEAIAAGWRRWAADPDAFFCYTNVEVIGRA